MADQAGMPATACRAVAEPFDTHRRWRSVWLVPCAAGLSAGQPLREDASCECGRSVSPRSHCPLGTASAEATDADDASTMGSDQIRHPPRDRCGILGEAERARTGEGEQASRSQPSELRRYPQQPHLNGRCIEGTGSRPLAWLVTAPKLNVRVRPRRVALVGAEARGDRSCCLSKKRLQPHLTLAYRANFEASTPRLPLTYDFDALPPRCERFPRATGFLLLKVDYGPPIDSRT